MHPRTPELMKQVRSAGSLEEKLAVLKNAYAGEPCYTLTCGPSMNAFWSERVRDFLKDKLVISVKQTYELAPEIMDYHVLNSWNYQPYQYADPQPIVFQERNGRDPDTPNSRPDLLFDIPEPSNLEKRLATTWRWDDFRFDRELARPWGPGVMYELAIYMWSHLGIREVTVMGWDLGELESKKMDHFFDQEKGWRSRIREGLEKRGMKKLAQSILAPPDQAVQNKPRIRPFEVKDIADSTKSLYEWLESNGIALRIVSDRSLVDACVPRVQI
jgi:hypothetical protein